jgi:hypothetical protein
MTVEQFNRVQETVEEILPIMLHLEEVVMLSIQIDRADGGSYEIVLLRFQMTIMSAKLALTEAQSGLREQGESWMTDENMEGLNDSLRDLRNISGEIDESGLEVIEVAENQVKERQDA